MLTAALSLAISALLIFFLNIYGYYDSLWFPTLLSSLTFVSITYALLFVIVNFLHTAFSCLLYGKEFRLALRKKRKTLSASEKLLPFTPEKTVFKKSKKKQVMAYSFEDKANKQSNAEPEYVCASSKSKRVFFWSEKRKPDSVELIAVSAYLKYFISSGDYISDINNYIVDAVADSYESTLIFLQVKIDYSFSSKLDSVSILHWTTVDDNSSSAVFVPDLQCFREKFQDQQIISSRKDLQSYTARIAKENPEVDLTFLRSKELDAFCAQLENLSELDSILS